MTHAEFFRVGSPYAGNTSNKETKEATLILKRLFFVGVPLIMEEEEHLV